MSETEPLPQPNEDQPDTPEDQVTLPGAVLEAAVLADLTRQEKSLKRRIEEQRAKVLDLLEQLPNVHGLLMKSGDAVRKSWYTSKAKPIAPSKLREVLADASEFVVEVVDLALLKKHYPTIHQRLGNVSSKRTIVVRLAGDKESGE